MNSDVLVDHVFDETSKSNLYDNVNTTHRDICHGGHQR